MTETANADWEDKIDDVPDGPPSKASSLLDKEQILGADDLPVERLDVPEWGGAVFLRTLTGAERDAFEASYVERDPDGKDPAARLHNFRARYLVRVLADAEGHLLFGPDDADALGGKSGKALEKLFAAARKLNGMSTEDVKELTENFTETQAEPLPSS